MSQYKKIEAVLSANLCKTTKFGGKLSVSSGGKRTAPLLSAWVKRPEQATTENWDGLRVVLGSKGIRVDMLGGACSKFFTKKTATEDQVVAALEFLFAQV